MNDSCHRSRVDIGVPGHPRYLSACNCTLYTETSGLGGSYPRGQVEIRGETRSYVGADQDDPYLGSHFCDRCGSTTHRAPLAADAPDRMGVNMRLFEPSELAGIEVRYVDRRNRDSGRHCYREPTVFGGTDMLP